MRAVKMALTGVMVAALVTGAVVYWAGIGPGIAGPSDPSGPADPRMGETFIYGEILSFDRTNPVLTIDQHFEPGSLDVDGSVQVAPDARVAANMGDGREEDSSLDALLPGHVVGIILRDDGVARFIIYDELDPAKGAIEPSDPTRGEAFIYAEILAVDLETRLLTIDQHFEPGSVDAGGSVRVAAVAQVRGLEDGQPVIPMDLADLQPGHVVGMIMTAEGTIRAILVDDVVGIIEPSDPTRGEVFVYAEVLAVDLDTRLITINQHMDSGSVDVGGSVRVAAAVQVRGLKDGHPVLPMTLADLRPGHIVGMILGPDGLARAILVD